MCSFLVKKQLGNKQAKVHPSLISGPQPELHKLPFVSLPNLTMITHIPIHIYTFAELSTHNCYAACLFSPLLSLRLLCYVWMSTNRKLWGTFPYNVNSFLVKVWSVLTLLVSSQRVQVHRTTEVTYRSRFFLSYTWQPGLIALLFQNSFLTDVFWVKHKLHIHFQLLLKHVMETWNVHGLKTVGHKYSGIDWWYKMMQNVQNDD